MNAAIEMAVKRFWKALIAALVPIVLSVLIQFVSTDELFQQQGLMFVQALLVALLLAVQKYWKERDTI